MNTSTGAMGHSYVSEVPGRTLGIWSFVLSFIFQVLGLIFGLIALAQSRRANVSNNFAVAGVIISSVLLVVGVTLAIVFYGAAVKA